MFRTIRIVVLLYILLIVAVTSWSARERRTDWDQPLWVAVYPINGDGSAAVAAYIGALDKTAFEPIESFMHAEAKRWNVALDDPVEVKLAPVVGETPPSPPRQGNALSIGLWSLKIRYWAWRHDTFDGPKDIKIFIVYFDPERTDRLAHSLGLQKGFLGVVNAFGASAYNGRNNVVVAHELLHTLGALDKYEPRTNRAIHPSGFAEPYKEPLYPQTKAEVMAGRIPVSQSSYKMPDRLQETVIGSHSAIEIGWRE